MCDCLFRSNVQLRLSTMVLGVGNGKRVMAKHVRAQHSSVPEVCFLNNRSDVELGLLVLPYELRRVCDCGNYDASLLGLKVLEPNLLKFGCLPYLSRRFARPSPCTILLNLMLKWSLTL